MLATLPQPLGDRCCNMRGEDSSTCMHTHDVRNVRGPLSTVGHTGCTEAMLDACSSVFCTVCALSSTSPWQLLNDVFGGGIITSF